MNKETLELLQQALEVGLNQLYPIEVEEAFETDLRKAVIESLFRDLTKNSYILVQWPESQEYMDKDWFDTEACIVYEIEKFGSAAYFIPIKRLIETQ